MDFITGPGTSYLENEAILSSRPYMSSVASFKEEVHELCSRDKFQWWRGTEEERVQGGEARADLVYLVRMDWMWAVMKAAELNKKVRGRWLAYGQGYPGFFKSIQVYEIILSENVKCFNHIITLCWWWIESPPPPHPYHHHHLLCESIQPIIRYAI